MAYTCTERMLEGDLSWSEKMKDDIRRVHHEQSLKNTQKELPSLLNFEKRVSRTRLWDIALSFGLQHTRGLQT